MGLDFITATYLPKRWGGGVLWCESAELGAGATFSLQLPVEYSSEAA